MRIDSSGRVGIGTSSPASDGKLTIHGTDTDSGILLSRSSGNDVAIHNIGGTLAFRTGGESTTLGGLTERMRIDSSGNVLVGETSNFIATSTSATGLALTQDGRFTLSRSAGTPMNVGKIGADGELIDFWKTGGHVGSIGSDFGYLTIGDASCRLLFLDSTSSIIPRGATNVGSNGAIDLGDSGSRFKDAYLSGGVYLGGTGSANKLEDYEEGTFTPSILNGWGILNPTYSTNSGFYTKVGNIVHVAFRITLSGGSTNANGLRLNGLPFTVGATTNVGTNLSGWFATASSNAENVFLGLEANDVHPLFYYKNANGTSTFLGTDAGTGFSMTFSGTYQTA